MTNLPDARSNRVDWCGFVTSRDAVSRRDACFFRGTAVDIQQTVRTTTETCPGCPSDAIALNRTSSLFVVAFVFKNERHEDFPSCLFKPIYSVCAKTSEGRCWRKHSGTGTRSHEEEHTRRNGYGRASLGSCGKRAREKGGRTCGPLWRKNSIFEIRCNLNVNFEFIWRTQGSKLTDFFRPWKSDKSGRLVFTYVTHIFVSLVVSLDDGWFVLPSLMLLLI